MVKCLSGKDSSGTVDSDELSCIPDYWVCDNWNDCGDASDEDLSICGMYVTWRAIILQLSLNFFSKLFYQTKQLIVVGKY